jgi:hypothetical protein
MMLWLSGTNADEMGQSGFTTRKVWHAVADV